MQLLVRFNKKKISTQLFKWKVNSLSQAGRIVLIQSDLATKANYQMQNFTLPPVILILSFLDKSYRNIFWSKNLNSRVPNLIGWDIICQPKKVRGLGLRKAEVNNITLQFKLLWKIVSSPDNLWVQLIKRNTLNLIIFSPMAMEKIDESPSYFQEGS